MTKEKKDKVKNFLRVSGYMATLPKNEFVTVDEIAKTLDMDNFSVRGSIQMSKLTLAKKGIILVNRIGNGYALSDFARFQQEIEKSIERAKSKLGFALKWVAALEASKLVNGDFESIKSTLRGNLNDLQKVAKLKIEDFETDEEYFEAMDAAMAGRDLVPQFVKEIPFKES